MNSARAWLLRERDPLLSSQKAICPHQRDSTKDLTVECHAQTSDLQNGQEIAWSWFKSLDLRLLICRSSMRKWTHRCPRQPHYLSPGSSSFRNISSICPQSDRVWPGDGHCFWPLGFVSLLAVRICEKHNKRKTWTKTVGKQEERKEERAGRAGEERQEWFPVS